MLDLDTFLTQLYVMVDDFCQSQLPPECSPGPAASLSRSEVVTLALLSRWRRFGSERAFYRFANRRLLPAFPQLPDRSQFNRLVREQLATIQAFFCHLARCLKRPPGSPTAYETLDRTALPTRNRRRRGRGWLAGLADYGHGGNLGSYYGLGLLVAVSADGVITGFGLAPASAKDQPLAEALLGARGQPQASPGRLPTAGDWAAGLYLADAGFSGRAYHHRWQASYRARVFSPPHGNQHGPKQPWPKGLRRQVAGLRQIVETAIARLQEEFGLVTERPHTLSGCLARVAARAALYNFCLWLNRQLGRPNLAFADLLDW